MSTNKSQKSKVKSKEELTQRSTEIHGVNGGYFSVVLCATLCNSVIVLKKIIYDKNSKSNS